MPDTQLPLGRMDHDRQVVQICHKTECLLKLLCLVEITGH